MLSLPAHILVADDEPMNRLILGTLLARHFPTCQVTAVADGQAALAHYDAHGAHVILTEAQMPNLTGHELVRLLRSRGDDVPIGLINGLDGRGAQRGSPALVDALVERPFDTWTFVPVVRELLAQSIRQLA